MEFVLVGITGESIDTFVYSIMIPSKKGPTLE